jgi:hypothetical protein
MTAGRRAPPARLPSASCGADQFDLFNVDFRYGGPFTRADERASPPAPVVVLSDVLNQQLYGGADSVGRTIRIAGRDFRIVGVMRQRPGKLHLWDFGVAPENIANVLVPSVFADQLRLSRCSRGRRLLPDLGWTTISHRRAASSNTGFASPRRRAPRGSRRRCPASTPQLAPASADEIARRFSKAPAPYRVFVSPDAGGAGGERHQT